MTTQIQYSIARSDEFSGATIFIDGETHVIGSDHATWEEVVELLADFSIRGDVPDEDVEYLRTLLTPAQAVSEKLQRLTERVTYANGTIFFDGDEIDNSLTEHIVRLIEAKDEAGWKAYVAFMENLYQNPSKKSRKHLYNFIADHGITITSDGQFIAYKGVRRDGTSVHAGYGIVDGEVFQSAHLPNAVGSVIEVPRSMVDDDREVACSTGLHAGTFAYASSFAPVLLTVKVNPRDVVSVPSDHSNAKIRTARYTVLELNQGEYTDPTYTEDEADNDFEPDEDEAVEFEPDEDVQDAPAPAPAPVQATAKAPASDFDQRVEAMKGLIPTLQRDGVNLRRHRNKKITEKNRVPFDEAARQLGVAF